VGVIALVDEATGYQQDRARDELNRILEAYISKELLPWTRRFPDDFFKHTFRLHGWEYKQGSMRSSALPRKVHAVTTLERISSGKDEFWEHFNKAFPTPKKPKDGDKQLSLEYDGMQPLEIAD